MNISVEHVQTANEKSRRLRELIRAPEILIMPGAWNVFSALLFESLGFQTIQGSSGALANDLGYADGEVIDRETMLSVYEGMASAVGVPVNADGEKGYGGPDEVRETVSRLIEIGIAGMNLEDSAPRRDAGQRTLIDIEDASAKIQSVMDTKRALESEFFLNARIDAFMVYEDKKRALAESIERGNRYAELGADCIFFVAVSDAETIATLAREVKAPISILAGASAPPPRKLEELGVARVSYGTSFFLQAVSGARAFAEALLAGADPSDMLQAGAAVAGAVRPIVRTSR